MTDKTEAQPEALRLAEHLENFRSFPDDLAAAVELRRQHAEIQQLKEDQRLCMQEASSLATAMFKKHYSHEPHWAPADGITNVPPAPPCPPRR